VNTRQALVASRDITPNVLAATIETQRKQLKDHLLIAERAWAQEDLETWARAARHAANVKKALEENVEMQTGMANLADLQQFTAGALIEAAVKSYREHGDKTFAPALKKAAAVMAPKKAGGARGPR